LIVLRIISMHMKRVDMTVQCAILSMVARGRERSAASGLQVMVRTGLAADANVFLTSAAGHLVVVTRSRRAR
jgi:hypothetical protein